LRLRGRDLGQDAARAVDHERPRLAEAHVARRAVDQRQPQLVLQTPDLLRQRGLGDVLALRRAGEVTLLVERDEGAQLAEVHGARSYALCLSIPGISGLGLLSRRPAP